jgi:hypothetical protein
LGRGYRSGVGVVKVLAEGMGGVLIVVRGSGKVLAMGMGQVLTVVRGPGKYWRRVWVRCWQWSGCWRRVWSVVWVWVLVLGQGLVRVW